VLDSTQRPPERDRVIRRQQRYFDCPPRHTSEDRTSAHPQEFGDKSLPLKILRVSLFGSRFCGDSLVFSRFYERVGGGGVPQLSVVGGQLSVANGQLSVAGCQLSVVRTCRVNRLGLRFRGSGSSCAMSNRRSFGCASARRAKEARRKSQADAPLRMTATESFPVTTNAPPKVTVAESFALTANAPLRMTVGEGSPESAELRPFNLAKSEWRKASRNLRYGGSHAG